MGAGIRKAGAECRVIAGPRPAQQGERLPVLRGSLLHVLVGDFHLAGECVEIGIAVDLPPMPSRDFVLRFGGFPAGGFLEGGRNIHVGTQIIGADGTAGQGKGQGQDGEQLHDETPAKGKGEGRREKGVPSFFYGLSLE